MATDIIPMSESSLISIRQNLRSSILGQISENIRIVIDALIFHPEAAVDMQALKDHIDQLVVFGAQLSSDLAGWEERCGAHYERLGKAFTENEAYHLAVDAYWAAYVRSKTTATKVERLAVVDAAKAIAQSNYSSSPL